MRTPTIAALALLGALLVAAPGAGPDVARVIVESWQGQPLGAHGIPAGWQGETWGRAASFDLTVVSDGERRALDLKSRADRSTITKDIRGRVVLERTPMLEWSWKAVALPPGGDARRRETTDQAAQLYVVWPRFPGPLRSRIIGYAWDTSAPAGSVIKSRKAPTVTYVIVRSGPADAGRWITERRDVVADFRAIYGEAPADPAAISLSIDSNDTASFAEAMFGAIIFSAR